MGYSNNKWRKILTILMIINLCFILFARFTRVFGATAEDYTSNTIVIENNTQTFNIGSVDSFGIVTVTLPSFYNDFDNILISAYYPDNDTTARGMIILSNDKLFIDSNGVIRGVSGGTYYYKGITYSKNSNGYYYNMSSQALSSFTKYGATTVAWWGVLPVGSYSAIRGNLYNYDNQNDVIVGIDATKFIVPYFDNVTEIENGYPDGVYISRGDFSENDYLYFHLLKITYTITENNSTIYYYSPKIFALNKDSKYYHTFVGDTENQYSYYSIPRASLSLDTNSSYLYVLSNSKQSITNSVGILEKDVDDGIYDVIQSDTAGVITTQDSINDKIQNIDDTINDNTISGDTETDIEDSLNFNNQNDGLNNLNGGFFSRLTTMLSNLLGYNLAEDTSVSLPLPNSNKSIVLHSKDIYDNITGALRLIINAFWIYIFSFYMWKFINKIYIAVSTGNILDTFSSSGEAITNDML